MWNAIDHPADIWLWCAAWSGVWLVLGLALHIRYLLHGMFGELRGLVSALSRTLVAFAEWWVARAAASRIVRSGAWHWVATVVLFFVLLAIALALMGEIGTGEFRGKKLMREAVAGVVSLVVVFLWAQGVIRMAH